MAGMKALTIWQPWASLLACGAKRFETRSWETSYRGPIAIHTAAMKVPQVLRKLFPLAEWSYHPDHDVREAFLHTIAEAMEIGYTYDSIMEVLNSFPTGCVVATANLIGCHKIATIHGERARCFDNDPFIGIGDGKTYTPDDVEYALGNWENGRFAWEFSDMKIFRDPVPAKGKQGLWNWEGG